MDAAGRPEPSQRAAVTPHPRRGSVDVLSTSYSFNPHKPQQKVEPNGCAYYFPNYGTNTSVPR